MQVECLVYEITTPTARKTFLKKVAYLFSYDCS